MCARSPSAAEPGPRTGLWHLPEQPCARQAGLIRSHPTQNSPQRPATCRAPSLAGMRLLTAALWSGLGVQTGPGPLPSIPREDTAVVVPPRAASALSAGVLLAAELVVWSPSPAPPAPGPHTSFFPGSGASVISTRCSETYETKTALLSLFGIPLWYHSQSPRVILQVGTRRGQQGPAQSPVQLGGCPTPGQAELHSGRLCPPPCPDPLFPSSQMCTQATAGPSRGPRALPWSAFLPASAPRLSP